MPIGCNDERPRMKMTSRSRWLLRLQSYSSAILVVAVAGLLAFLSTRYEVSFDWTAAKRHTLSAASVAVLKTMKDPITITAFAREGTPEDKAIRDRIVFLVDRYRRIKPEIHLDFVNPDRAPDRVRDLGIRLNGELVVSYQGRDQHVETHTEQAMTNALQSLARATERWLCFSRDTASAICWARPIATSARSAINCASADSRSSRWRWRAAAPSPTTPRYW